LAVAAKTVLYYEGYIRSFNGDGLLAFWPAEYKFGVNKAVKAAMTTKWLLDIKLSSIFEIYEKIDFGIGIDWSETYILRAGRRRDPQNNDLVFIGRCVNFATAIADQAHAPGHIEISDIIYNNLEEDSLYGKNSSDEKVDMWHDGKVEWKGESWKTKVTYWYRLLEE
jgi:class 3 adenylate cyclase